MVSPTSSGDLPSSTVAFTDPMLQQSIFPSLSLASLNGSGSPLPCVPPDAHAFGTRGHFTAPPSATHSLFPFSDDEQMHEAARADFGWSAGDVFAGADLDGGVSGMTIGTPVRPGARRSVPLPHSSMEMPSPLGMPFVSHEAPVSNASGRYAPSPSPMTPIRTPHARTLAPSPQLHGVEEDTPVRNVPMSPENTLGGAVPYDMSVTPPTLYPYGITPMTPYTDARASDFAARRTHHSGPSISSSSHVSMSTPDYASTNHSIGSSTDLRSPGPPFLTPSERKSFDMGDSPMRSAPMPGMEMLGGMPIPHPYSFTALPHRVSQPNTCVAMSSPLAEPFAMEQYKTAPHAQQNGMLVLDQGQPGSKTMARVVSAPPLQSPSEQTKRDADAQQAPLTEPMSFPASPATMSFNLPVNTTAMVRKCCTPYTKTPSLPHPQNPFSPSDMDHFHAPAMTSSKSMGALASPVPLSPATPSMARQRSRLTQSFSLPDDEISSLLDVEAYATTPSRGPRGRALPPLVVSSADKQHVCHCGRRFKRMEHLKRHSRTHTQERPHKCPVESCGKSFGRSDNLAQHVKTHFRPTGSAAGRPGDAFHPAAMSPDDRPRQRQMRHVPYAAAAAAAAAVLSSAGTPPRDPSEATPTPPPDTRSPHALLHKDAVPSTGAG
ncbi:hypothetical protein MSPP1_000514 [Malassezia sp. CBS 17886]|nr:hypothetical protein MSPP1_000514 [Malassezia sp. CBS 17886]